MTTKRVSMDKVLHTLAGTTRPAIVARMIVDAKAGGCIDCGKLYPISVMEFDHVRDKKHFVIGGTSNCSVKMTEFEIAKCDVRCPTCHRLRHYWMEFPDDPFFYSYIIPTRWVEAKRLFMNGYQSAE